jgi:hypothetical protein
MARTYKRDSSGRFAGGGGSSAGSRGGSGGRKRGRPAGPSGGKVGTRTEQRKSAAAQASRTRSFSSKAPVSSGRAAYAEARSRARLEQSLGYKGAFAEVKAMERRRAATPGVTGKKPPASGRKVGSTTEQKKAAAAQAARTAQFSSKAAPNAAKSAYKAARSAMRQARMLAGGRTDTKGVAKGRTDAGAQRIRANVAAVKAAAKKVQRMEATRGKYKPRRSR